MATLARQTNEGYRGSERAMDVRFADDQLVVDLRDGRTISTPIIWYPRLRDASDEERGNWRLNGSGIGIHWPDIDEDLSVEGMLDGRPAVGWDR
ncbi:MULTISPECIES: DUF2442 domain-containing protein [Sphingosinicellaceae]|uniref:DUF2442 domain-containing protein n=1 Tax=Sphingosinicellaceae TaxID=2820280 RepID=UPI001C1DD6F0|nr:MULTISPECIES: DUF2442 domain-containing protein [Polymorphobacter]QYE34255.1 DUF2442 domain-containing protein [Polymorphobacter sp. PAMC 29334]UAJ09434.1 DUF2442 domain-containing protein [Polymorphobacter megasporae]